MGEPASSEVLWRSYAHMAHQLGIFETVRARLPDETKPLWDGTGTRAWYPLRHFRALVVALSQLPNATYEEYSYSLTRDRFGPIISGLLRVAFAMSGASPHTVFRRFPVLVTLGLKGLHATYTRQSDSTGELVISYPEPWPEAASIGWTGIIRYLFETSGHSEGRVTSVLMTDDRTFRIGLSW